jgi:oxalate decarboxylase/phosphoglucose isomerase-like protein (cupin superfamily)
MIMQKIGQGYVVYGEDVEALQFDWGTLKMHNEPAVTGSQRFSSGVVIVNPGMGHARHNHPGCDEIIYVISGEIEQMIDDQPPVRLHQGASIFIPADVYHATLNVGWKPAELFIIYSPPGPERFFRTLPGCKVTPPENAPQP